MLTPRRSVGRGALLAIVLTACTFGSLATARASDVPKQILVLNATRPDDQFSVVSARELPKLLGEGLEGRVDFYVEHFDFVRFPDPEYERAYLDLLRMKYAEKRIDLLIVIGNIAVDFMSRHRDTLWRGTPAVFYSLDP